MVCGCRGASGIMAAQQELVVLTRDEKNKATVNLHGLLPSLHALALCDGRRAVFSPVGGTLQSWVHDGTEMIFVR